MRLPYYWDEAGYYVPAARDILLHGSLIPRTTVSNAHPPLVLAWIALWWKVVGDAPVVTRTAMLVAAAFALLGVFRLAERVANTQVAIASTLCTAVYPVFFAQSSLAQVDLCAAGLTFWALSSYVADDVVGAAIWFSLAALAKETAILAPAALAGWEMIGWFACKSSWSKFWVGDGATFGVENSCGPSGTSSSTSLLPGTAGPGFPSPPLRGWSLPAVMRRFAQYLAPAVVLAGWYVFHYSRTGYVFGNPEFFRYNVAATLSLTRFLLALVMRVWQVLGYLHLWALTLPTVIAMWLLAPQRALVVGHLAGADQRGRAALDRTAGGGDPHTGVLAESTRAGDSHLERPRICIPVQIIFEVVVFAYVVAMALIGGAVLARYMLPAVPLVIILCVSTFWRRMRFWRSAIGFAAMALIAGWFWNPHYGFSPEDNLAYRDYVEMHEDGERFLEARYPMARVLTAWPGSDELTRPWLGYVTRPMRVVRIENFSLEEVLSAAELRSNDGAQYDVALIFSTKYETGPAIWDRWPWWPALKARFFGFHRDLPPAVAAQILGGRKVFSEERAGQWIAVIEIDHDSIENAEAVFMARRTSFRRGHEEGR